MDVFRCYFVKENSPSQKALTRNDWLKISQKYRTKYCSGSIDYIVYRSLTNRRLWSPMFMIKSNCSMSESVHRVHLTVDFLQNIQCILWTFWGYHVQTGVSVLSDDWKYYLYSLAVDIQGVPENMRHAVFFASNVRPYK